MMPAYAELTLNWHANQYVAQLEVALGANVAADAFCNIRAFKGYSTEE